MGQTTSRSVRESLDEQFKYIKKYSNGCYGQLTLVESKTTFSKYALKQVLSDNPDVSNVLRKKKQQSHSNIINLVEYWIKDQASLCSNISQVYLLLEYQQMTLEDEIIERQLKHKYFTINEIKKIIQSSISALSHLNKSKNNFHIGLQNTLITSKCDIKVVEPDIMSNNLVDIEAQSTKKKYYICEQPELTQQSSEDQGIGNGSKAKASVFYLGVMMLSCCMLDESFQQQVISNGAYDFQKLRQASKSLSERYRKISNLVEKMVKKNPFKRPSYEDILLQLTPRLEKTRNVFQERCNID